MSEKLARGFHEVYKRLAPLWYKTREETRDFDPKSPNGKLMIRVCGEVFGEAVEIERLQAEIKELRGLLKECQIYVEARMSSVDIELRDRIEKEVGDE